MCKSYNMPIVRKFCINMVVKSDDDTISNIYAQRRQIIESIAPVSAALIPCCFWSIGTTVNFSARFCVPLYRWIFLSLCGYCYRYSKPCSSIWCDAIRNINVTPFEILTKPSLLDRTANLSFKKQRRCLVAKEAVSVSQLQLTMTHPTSRVALCHGSHWDMSNAACLAAHFALG